MRDSLQYSMNPCIQYTEIKIINETVVQFYCIPSEKEKLNIKKDNTYFTLALLGSTALRGSRLQSSNNKIVLKLLNQFSESLNYCFKFFYWN